MDIRKEIVYKARCTMCPTWGPASLSENGAELRAKRMGWLVLYATPTETIEFTLCPWCAAKARKGEMK